MPHVNQMNGLPIRYATVTDIRGPGRRSVWSTHTTIGAARRAIFDFTRVSFGGLVHDGASWWVAEVDVRGADTYGQSRIIAYLPEGPYSRTDRPSVGSRSVS